MKICGFHTAPCHDVAYTILEDGYPIIHYELERYNRIKMTSGDIISVLRETYDEADNITHFSCNWRGLHQGPDHAFDSPYSLRNHTSESYAWIESTVKKNNGKFYRPSHHLTHAANAFFSSNFEESLIVTMDGGGGDKNTEGQYVLSSFAIFEGRDIEVTPIKIFPYKEINIGGYWSSSTEKIFGLSSSSPIGNQSGSVMALAALGDPEKYYKDFMSTEFRPANLNSVLSKFFNSAKGSQLSYDVAAALQKTTEDFVKRTIAPFVKESKSRNLCLSGGVALNSVMVGKIWDWFGDRFDNIYVCPVPYDAGVAIGCAQLIWHQYLENPRIEWKDNFTPYLGQIYKDEEIMSSLKKFKDNNKIDFETCSMDGLVQKLANQNIVSIFGGRSESGRRALGNRSILADPRSPSMKNTINEKVKHRQWYRPFAPSILRERVSEWFERDVDSPYMSMVVNFKIEKRDIVPAVVHFDGSARLQTVTENDNQWYYNLLKHWEAHTGVPILLNTSFNDREPIVETPENAIDCFLRTNIDHLYFYEPQILVSKPKKIREIIHRQERPVKR